MMRLTCLSMVLIGTLLVLYAILSWHQASGPERDNWCSSEQDIEDILSNGKPSDDGNIWMPKRCQMYEYSRAEARKCLIKTSKFRRNYFVFFGDSRARHVFDLFVNFLDPTHDDKFRHIEQTTMYDQYVEIPEIQTRIESKWRTYPDESMIRTYRNWLYGAGAWRRTVPSYINVYTGLWTLKFRRPIVQYAKALTELLPLVDQLAKDVPLVWTIQPDVVHGKKYSNEEVNFINSNFITLNNITITKLKEFPNIKIGMSSKDMAENRKADYLDGFHVNRQSVYHETMILMNLWCNKVMLTDEEYCCVKSKSSYWMK